MQRTGAILWLSVLDLARVAADEPVAFDSDNTKQFATKEGTLRPELRAEAIAAGVRVEYFTTLSAFVESIAKPVAALDADWLLSEIPLVDVFSSAVNRICERGDWRIRQRLESPEQLGEMPDIDYSGLRLDHHFVYSMADGSYRFQGLYSGTIDVSYGVFVPVGLHVGRGWEEDGSLGRESIRYVSAPVSVYLQVEGVARENHVVSWSLSFFDEQ